MCLHVCAAEASLVVVEEQRKFLWCAPPLSETQTAPTVNTQHSNAQSTIHRHTQAHVITAWPPALMPSSILYCVSLAGSGVSLLNMQAKSQTFLLHWKLNYNLCRLWIFLSYQWSGCSRNLHFCYVSRPVLCCTWLWSNSSPLTLLDDKWMKEHSFCNGSFNFLLQ